MLASVLKMIGVDIAIVVVWSVLIGALAPRLPRRWLEARISSFPPMPWETPAFYRRFGVTAMARRLPEWGSIFGGQSKSQLGGTDPESLHTYLIEVRRAQWVHVLSMISWVWLIPFNPWWLTLAFAVIVTLGNLPFLMILRFNNARLNRLLALTSDD